MAWGAIYTVGATDGAGQNSPQALACERAGFIVDTRVQDACRRRLLMTVPAPLRAKFEELGADFVRIDLPLGAYIQPTKQASAAG